MHKPTDHLTQDEVFDKFLQDGNLSDVPNDYLNDCLDAFGLICLLIVLFYFFN